jgi:HPt (histidine-containing phosphotransfer) domain-containing protein
MNEMTISEKFLKEWEQRMDKKKKTLSEEAAVRLIEEEKAKKRKLEQAADDLRKSYLRRTGRREMKP